MESPDKPLINRIAQSSLITIDLEDLVKPKQYAYFDIKDFLFQGIVLKEKEFRVALIELDWESFRDKVLLIFCSADAIVPKWAYMLIASYANTVALEVFFGTEDIYRKQQFLAAIHELDGAEYQDARIVVKGCSKDEVPISAYVALLAKLQPYVKSLMYGEPCSTVPIYKRS